MIIKDCVQNDDGSLDFNFHVDANESAFLMDFAIKELVRRGIFTVAVDEAQQQVDLFKESDGKLN